jgi:xyloglucan-specific exo-beta-1,4-glucanase
MRPPPKPAECKYVVTRTWWGGAIAELRITNTSAATISGWTVNWTYTDNSIVDGGFGTGLTGSAPSYTGTNSGRGTTTSLRAKRSG